MPQEKTKDKEYKKQAVVLDVDGVLNSYSNSRFYFQFIFKSFRNMAKVRSRKELLRELPKLKKHGGPNALFSFAKEFCRDDNTFEAYKNNLINSLNFNLIKHDPSLRGMMKNLSNYGDICVRSDGLTDISYAAWQRVIEDRPSASIKYHLKTNKKGETFRTTDFNNQNITISGIEDNGFKVKTDLESWKKFSDKHKIDLEKSVLIDDSRDNLDTAKKLNMTTVHISKLDSLLQGTGLGTIYNHSLSDILGERLSSTVKRLKISYGKKVDLKQLFKALLQGKSEEKETANALQNNLFFER